MFLCKNRTIHLPILIKEGCERAQCHGCVRSYVRVCVCMGQRICRFVCVFVFLCVRYNDSITSTTVVGSSIHKFNWGLSFAFCQADIYTKCACSSQSTKSMPFNYWFFVVVVAAKAILLAVNVFKFTSLDDLFHVMCHYLEQFTFFLFPNFFDSSVDINHVAHKTQRLSISPLKKKTSGIGTCSHYLHTTEK